MQCLHCGLNNTENAVHCAQCGAVLKAPARKKWLVVDVIVASIALTVFVVLFTIWTFTSPSEQQYSVFGEIVERANQDTAENEILGLWFESRGLGTISFSTDGSFISDFAGIQTSGTYDYDAATCTGEMSFDTEGQKGVPWAIKYENGFLKVNDELCTKKFV